MTGESVAAPEFSTSVSYGLMLSRRLYYGKGASPAPASMSRSLSSTENYIPTAVTAYAVISEPSAVDNPDVPSYQPYVHGRCEPPALIPLNMHEVSMEVECWMDTTFVTLSGSWRVHCIMAGRRCDCRIAVPMGEQGSILRVEVDISGTETTSHNSKWVTLADSEDMEKAAKYGDGCFLTPHIYTFRIPQVDGGSNVSIRVCWSQKLIYRDGQFWLTVPFSFPAYVNPVGKNIPKREKIQVNVNSGIGTEHLIKCSSHPLKELSREVRKLSFIYEAEVPAWSTSDLEFAYTVTSSDIFGGFFLQSPALSDFDEREMFCFYLFPGNKQIRKVFKKEVVFVVDISESMTGLPIENVKDALLASLSQLNPQDSFNIITFNSEIRLFSPTMVLSTHGSILKATQWLSSNILTTDGGTNIMQPLKQAMKLLSDPGGSIPLIFLITDGSVEDEREICNVVKSYSTSRRSVSPRICTFGIGLYCNHYFLQMLAQIGRGQYDCTYNADNIELRLERLFSTASSIILADITMDIPENIDSVEFFPSHIPDLSFGSPLIVSGRYKGDFPETIKVKGRLADMSTFITDLKVQNAKDLPFDRQILTRRQIDILTCHAWLSESKELEEKVAKISLQTSFPSEYTGLILLQTDGKKEVPEQMLLQEIFNKISLPKRGDSNTQKLVFLGRVGVGFGNLAATAKNIPPGIDEPKSPEGAEILVKAASNLSIMLVDRCCCMCFIQACSHTSNQCSIVFTQLCTALACFECANCCYELCACF